MPLRIHYLDNLVLCHTQYGTLTDSLQVPAEKIFAKTEPCSVSFAARLGRMRRREVVWGRINREKI